MEDAKSAALDPDIDRKQPCMHAVPMLMDTETSDPLTRTLNYINIRAHVHSTHPLIHGK